MEAVGKVVWLALCYAGGIAFGVLLHELGHAMIALIATPQRVQVAIGRKGSSAAFSAGRLEFVFRSKGIRYGETRYERHLEKLGTQIVVALGGPLASLLACGFFGWLATTGSVWSWEWLAWLGLCVSSFRILVVALWPIEYRPEGPKGKEIWVSDGLDVWRMWRKLRARN